jgi:hypothetical protein
MNATPPTPAAASARCWNCQEALQVGSERCLFCGVRQESAPTAFLVAPSGVAPAPIAGRAAAPTAAATPQPTMAALPVARPGVTQSAGPGFAGTIAGGARRILAFTIDVAVVVAAAVTAYVLTSQPIYAAIAAFELVVGLWVLEARTGLTIGNALVRIRASREDAPFSPGIGRSFARAIITGVGFLAFGIGAWVVVASSSWDSARRGRSWADRAAHTLVVAVPRRERVLAAKPVAVPTGPLPAGVVSVSGAAAPAAPTMGGVKVAPGVQIVQQAEPVVLAAPQVISTAARPSMLNENSASASSTGVGGEFAASPVPVVNAPVAPMSRGDAAEGSDGTLLLIFDTGQREQLATPVSVNLGRKPTATEPTDKLIIINDPESTVSKNHVRIEHSRGSTWVIDGGSTNGTDLLSDDGEVRRLSAGERVLLDEGTRIRVGNRAFTISTILGEKQ